MDNSPANTTTSQLNNSSLEYSISPQSNDSVQDQKEFRWYFSDYTTDLAYYNEIPEYRRAINALADWTIGKGFSVKATGDQKALDHVSGMGKDTALSIIWQLFVTSKFAGDSFAHIVREDKEDATSALLNIKPLSPEKMSVVFDDNGMIMGYELIDAKTKNMIKKFKPYEIFHLCNDRIVDEVHGNSASKACKWVFDARKEAMEDWRRISHRSTIRVLYVDMENVTRVTTLREQYKEGIENGEILILPGKKGTDYEFEDLVLPPVEAYMRWIEYLENVFYQIIGVPRVIATSENYTEAASKVGVFTFEPVYIREQKRLEAAIFKQLGIEISFLRPASLVDNMQSDEMKNSGMMRFQPNDLNPMAGQNNG